MKHEHLPDWCQVYGMMGHEFKEHGGGVHPPFALIYKSLQALATTAWGTRCRNNSQKAKKHNTQEGGTAIEKGSDHHEVVACQQDDTDMEAVDSNRKRTSDEVVGRPNPVATTGMELVLVPKAGGSVIPPSPHRNKTPRGLGLQCRMRKHQWWTEEDPSRGEKTMMQDRRPLRRRTAGHNEFVVLEFSRDWQCPHNSRASQTHTKVCP